MEIYMERFYSWQLPCQHPMSLLWRYILHELVLSLPASKHFWAKTWKVLHKSSSGSNFLQWLHKHNFPNNCQMESNVCSYYFEIKIFFLLENNYVNIFLLPWGDLHPLASVLSHRGLLWCWTDLPLRWMFGRLAWLRSPTRLTYSS